MGIKEIRKELRLTQSEFARMFGIHQTAVSQWETGRTSPDTEMVIHIARATGHSVDEVLGVHMQGPVPLGGEIIEVEMPDDSMAGARIQKGDRVYVRLCADQADGNLVAIQNGGKKRIRFIRFIGGERFFVDARMPARIEKAEDEDRIIGTVIGFYADLGKEN